ESQNLAASQRGSVIIDRAGSLELPFEVKMTCSDGEHPIRRLHGDMRQWLLEFNHDAELVEVEIDPQRMLQLDDDLLTHRWRLETTGARLFQTHSALSWASWLLILGAS